MVGTLEERTEDGRGACSVQSTLLVLFCFSPFFPLSFMRCLTLSSHHQRQFHRLVEMLIQLHLNPADTRSAKAYRLQVKERLYRFNYVSVRGLYVRGWLSSLDGPECTGDACSA
jgi:hypothetical protein